MFSFWQKHMTMNPSIPTEWIKMNEPKFQPKHHCIFTLPWPPQYWGGGMNQYLLSQTKLNLVQQLLSMPPQYTRTRADFSNNRLILSRLSFTTFQAFHHSFCALSPHLPAALAVVEEEIQYWEVRFKLNSSKMNLSVKTNLIVLWWSTPNSV